MNTAERLAHALTRVSRWLAVSEVSRKLRVPERTVQSWCATGRAVAIKVGRHWRISADWLAAQMAPATEPTVPEVIVRRRMN